jgi:hypothetical protein
MLSPKPAERMVVGIDGAFVKAGHTRPGQRHQFEILTGRVEALPDPQVFTDFDLTEIDNGNLGFRSER